MVAIWLTYGFIVWVFAGFVLFALFSIVVFVYSCYSKSKCLQLFAAFTFCMSVASFVVITVLSPNIIAQFFNEINLIKLTDS